MKKPYWLLAAMLLASGAPAKVQNTPAATNASVAGGRADASSMVAPAVALRRGIDKLLAFLSADQRPSQEALAAFLNQEIAPYFDFDYMASAAGGRLYERLGAQERASVAQQIKQSFLTKMAEKLAGYGNQQIRFLPPRTDPTGGAAEVSVAVLNPGRYPARLDFRLYRAGQEWLVYDVSANGQSAIVHYRRQLMRQAREQHMRELRQINRPVVRDAPQYMPRPGYGPPTRQR